MPVTLNLIPLMMLFSMISLLLTKEKFLMCLLNLEAMTLSLFLLTLMSSFIISPTESLNSLTILSMSACEASLGLACLVNIMRSHGNDNLKSITNIKC